MLDSKIIYCVKVNSPEEMKQAQSRAFSLGWGFMDYGDGSDYIDSDRNFNHLDCNELYLEIDPDTYLECSIDMYETYVENLKRLGETYQKLELNEFLELTSDMSVEINMLNVKLDVLRRKLENVQKELEEFVYFDNGRIEHITTGFGGVLDSFIEVLKG